MTGTDHRFPSGDNSSSDHPAGFPLLPDRSNRLADAVRRSRPIVLGTSTLSTVARGLVLTALVGGVTTWTIYDRTVTLEVDGQTRQVKIFGTEVSDALAAAGVDPGARDLVSPGEGESVADGATVRVRYARQFTVTTDGVEQVFWTHERTVDSAIQAVGLRLEGAALSTSRSQAIGRQGLALDAVTRKDATVVVAGVAQPVASTARDVSGLLSDAGIAVDGDDRVTPAATTVVTAGITVTVNRVEVTQVPQEVAIVAPVRTVDSADLYRGETDVVDEGAAGVERITFDVTLVDGVEESRLETARTVTTAPVERVVAKGTKERPVAVAATGSGATAAAGTPAAAVGSDVDSLNWTALAACESGGNASIVSSNGLYHGLYQFDAGTWRSMGGSGVASSAPASEQTARAKALYASRGASPWPVCGRKLFT